MRSRGSRFTQCHQVIRRSSAASQLTPPTLDRGILNGLRTVVYDSSMATVWYCSGVPDRAMWRRIIFAKLDEVCLALYCNISVRGFGHLSFTALNHQGFCMKVECHQPLGSWGALKPWTICRNSSAREAKQKPLPMSFIPSLGLLSSARSRVRFPQSCWEDLLPPGPQAPALRPS